MYYEINIAQRDEAGRYQHLFATHTRSCTSRARAKRVYEALAARFPAPEFHLSISLYWDAGKYVGPEELDEPPEIPTYIPTQDSHSND